MNHTWITSDWHFGHTTLVVKGYRVLGYEGLIGYRLREVFKPGDTLINLGDLYIGTAGKDWVRDLVSQLNLRSPRAVILVRGNHDSGSVTSYLKLGFSSVCDGFRLDIGGKKIHFSHRPEEICSKTSYSTLPRTSLPSPIPSDVDYNIHGHLHNNDHRSTEGIEDGKHILISLEHLDYRPAGLDCLLNLGVTPQFKGGKFRGLATKVTASEVACNGGKQGL